MGIPSPCTRCRRYPAVKGSSLCLGCGERAQDQDVAYRGNATARGYDHKWRALRFKYVEAHPFCQDCREEGRFSPTEIVDHITPHRGDDALRLSWDNLRSLCRSHHARKTHAEGAGHRAPHTNG